MRSHRTGKRWAIALIQKMWDTAWDLWEHRNGVLHEKDNLVIQSMGIHLNQRVTRVYLALCSRPLQTNDRHLVQLLLSFAGVLVSISLTFARTSLWSVSLFLWFLSPVFLWL
jgi:hypothetical protein